MSQKDNISALVETSLIAALAMALSYIPDFASWFSPSFGAIPLVLFSLRRGLKYGVLAGFIWGLLHFALGKIWFLSLSQVVIEYLLAFTSMGVTGLVSPHFQKYHALNQKNKALLWALFGAFLAVFIRYSFHYIAGVIFWGSYAPDGMSPYWYSFMVNGTAAILTFFIVSLSLILIIPRQGKLLTDK